MTVPRALALALGLAVLGAPFGAEAANPALTPISAEVVQNEKSNPTGNRTTQLNTAPSLDETYASREASAKDLEKFEGGHGGLYIGGGAATLVIVLLILIIVL